MELVREYIGQPRTPTEFRYISKRSISVTYKSVSEVNNKPRELVSTYLNIQLLKNDTTLWAA